MFQDLFMGLLKNILPGVYLIWAEQSNHFKKPCPFFFRKEMIRVG